MGVIAMYKSAMLTSAGIHLEEARNNERTNSFDPEKDFISQRDAITEVFTRLVRMPEKRSGLRKTPLIEYITGEYDDFDEIRFSFESEPNFWVPAHLLFPKDASTYKKIPLVICLQGHSTGMHISLGRPKYPGDDETIKSGDRDFALQAVKRGYAAAIIEQRGFGELKTDIAPSAGCHQVAMQAFMLGRTLIGERIYDVSRLIDVIEKSGDILDKFYSIDLNKIGIMGNSGGGTTAYQAACVEKRIKVAMPSCYFNTYFDSIMSLHHCTCNYIPDILKYMEMPDQALMIAPRPLIIVSGKNDNIFPLEAVQRGFETVKQIYAKAGAPDNVTLIVGSGGHRFYADDSWGIFDNYMRGI
jgi:dienelactone hydrolase